MVLLGISCVDKRSVYYKKGVYTDIMKKLKKEVILACACVIFLILLCISAVIVKNNKQDTVVVQQNTAQTIQEPTETKKGIENRENILSQMWKYLNGDQNNLKETVTKSNSDTTSVDSIISNKKDASNSSKKTKDSQKKNKKENDNKEIIQSKDKIYTVYEAQKLGAVPLKNKDGSIMSNDQKMAFLQEQTDKDKQAMKVIAIKSGLKIENETNKTLQADSGNLIRVNYTGFEENNFSRIDITYDELVEDDIVIKDLKKLEKVDNNIEMNKVKEVLQKVKKAKLQDQPKALITVVKIDEKFADAIVKSKKYTYIAKRYESGRLTVSISAYEY